MRKSLLLISALVLTVLSYGQYDWDATTVPADAGTGKEWKLQENMSDDFNYTFNASTSTQYINGKWWNFWHNPWDGPGPTQWKPENISVANSHLSIKATRDGSYKEFEQGGTTYTNIKATQMGCMTSKEHVQYPVFVEARVKIADAVFANNIWMISDDDHEEIDICENYGGAGDDDRNDWYDRSIHLSHHVFMRDASGIAWDAANNRWGDYQPTGSEAGDGVGEGVDGTWYWESGKNNWAGEYATIGVYWKSTNHLEYYVNGNWVRTLSDKSYSYKNEFGTTVSVDKTFSVIDKYDYAGADDLNKPMKLIINIEAQDWNAVAGRMPTDAEITSRPDDHIMHVDWIRVYKPVDEGSSDPGTGTASGQSVKIEAEDFTSTGSTGIYVNDDSSQGVKKGTGVINWVQDGDWAEYTVNIPTDGDYQIKYNVGAPGGEFAGDPNIKVYIDGFLISSDSIALTGGWDTYVEQTASSYATNLTAGNHTFKFETSGSEWQFNTDYFTLTEIIYTSSEDNIAEKTAIYPNPTTGVINIEAAENTTIEIFNIVGTKLYESSANEGETTTVDISEFGTGIYFVKTGDSVERVIVE